MLNRFAECVTNGGFDLRRVQKTFRLQGELRKTVPHNDGKITYANLLLLLLQQNGANSPEVDFMKRSRDAIQEVANMYTHTDACRTLNKPSGWVSRKIALHRIREIPGAVKELRKNPSKGHYLITPFGMSILRALAQ